MRLLIGLRAGALVSLTLVSLSLLRCAQSGDDLEPAAEDSTPVIDTQSRPELSTPEARPDPRRNSRVPEPDAPNLYDPEAAIQAGDLEAVILESTGGGLRPEVTSIQVTNKGTKEVSGFAVAIRFLDANGKRLKTEYLKVDRYEVIRGGFPKTFPVHISGPAGTQEVKAEVISDIALDQAEESIRILKEDAAKEDNPPK